jgi:hypothetical protein
MWHYLLKAIELPLPLVLILGGPGMFFRSRRAVISKVHSGRWNMEGDAFIPDVLGYVRILEQRRGVWFAWQNIAGLVLFSRARKRLRLTCGLASPQTAVNMNRTDFSPRCRIFSYSLSWLEIRCR